MLRSCGDEAIEMPGQLDEVVALFIRKDGAMIKKNNKKIFSSNHKQRQQQEPLAGIASL